MAKIKPSPEPKLELNELDKCYIEVNKHKTVEDLSKKVRKPPHLVAEFLQEVNPSTPEYKPTPSQNKFINKTEGQKGGVTIMTNSASEDGDNTIDERHVLRMKIQRAMEEGQIDFANFLQVQLEGLAPNVPQENIFADCVYVQPR